MTEDGRGHPVEVNIGGCRCPGDPRPHPDGDVVTLAGRPSLQLGLAANAAVANATDVNDLQAALGSVFVRYGVIAWNIVDERGRPVTPTGPVVEARLTWDCGGLEVADAAADLYGAAVLDPLARGLSTSQAPGPTDGSTSAPSQSEGMTPSSSGPSSPSPQETPN